MTINIINFMHFIEIMVTKDIIKIREVEKMNNKKWVDWAIELQSLAQAGLTYGHDVYDQERYERIREISAEIMAYQNDIPLEKVKDLFCNESGYQTPK